VASIQRNRRIADLIQREVAQLLYLEARDPRFKTVSIMAVDVARDLSYANVFVVFNEEEQGDKILKALNDAAGYFRSHIAKSVSLRKSPKIVFHIDKVFLHSQKMSELLADVNPDLTEE